VRLKLPISLAKFPLYKGFPTLKVRLTPKSQKLSKTRVRLIKGVRSVRLMRTLSPSCSDSQSVTSELTVRRDELNLSFGYFSCQRYSDYCKLREENFITYNKSGLITLTQKKTGKKVEVPIFDDRVYELCEEYNYNFPDITAQKMNLKIKVVGHESQKNFEGYIRIGISEQAQRVGDKIKAAREAMNK